MGPAHPVVAKRRSARPTSDVVALAPRCFPARIAVETVMSIRQMARQNRTWGAERIRGELLKLGIRVAKRTIEKYMRSARRGTSPGRQTWSTFMKNHADEIWACDFVQTYDAPFRQVLEHISQPQAHLDLDPHCCSASHPMRDAHS